MRRYDEPIAGCDFAFQLRVGPSGIPEEYAQAGRCSLGIERHLDQWLERREKYFAHNPVGLVQGDVAMQHRE
ncbi:MAG TPA: hypothetical protein VIC32_07845 [Terriglobales bacterium]